jgi:hypothetical protein
MRQRYLKRIGMFFIILCVALSRPVPVETSPGGVDPFQPERVTQFGTPMRDQVSGLSKDDLGGIYLGGPTYGDLGGVNQGGSDIWLEHRDRQGQGRWLHQIGSKENDNCAAATIAHGSGFVYVVSSTPGELGGPNQGGEDLVVAQYGLDGTLNWIEQIGTRVDECHGGGPIAIEPNGGVFAAGAIGGDFGGPSAGLDDAFLVHYDRNGNLAWIRQIGTPGYDYAEAVVSDGSGGVYVAGYGDGVLAGPGGGGYDAWIARYDGAGVQLWIRQFGSAGPDFSISAAPVEVGLGGVYVSGATGGSLEGPHAGEADGWVARFDSDGNEVWIRQFGSAGNELATTLAPNGSGGVFVAGWTDDSLAGTNAGGRDAFVMEYNFAGHRIFARQIGTSEWDEAWAATFDPFTRVLYVGGHTKGNLGGPNLGEQDAFVAEFRR